VVIRHYEHLGAGIDYGEVERMKAALTEACTEVAKAERTDSPVYTFLADLIPPAIRDVAVREAAQERRATQQALADVHDENEKAALTTPLAPLMQAAMAARAAGNFKRMRDILGGVRAVQADNVDPFVVQQLALATYKAKDPTPRQALVDAIAILELLGPDTSTDPETLGLSGAIHKRLYEIADRPAEERRAALDKAIAAYEKGFFLKNDFYNGINYAFLLDCRAADATGDDAIADRVQARRIRARVLAICDELLKNGIKGESAADKASQEYWIRATKAEALLGLKQTDAFTAAFQDAKAIKPAPESWMIESTQEQLDKLSALLGVKT
jgi:hypothetical protein